MAPMNLAFGRTLATYDYVLHIHGKRSADGSILSGWRSHLETSKNPVCDEVFGRRGMWLAAIGLDLTLA